MGTLATRRVSGWRTALKLGRVSNLPTVWSNVIAGCALAGGAGVELVLVLCAAVSVMYVAGMFLNDAFDRKIDAQERPERPIPAGDIEADAVFVAGGALLVVGIVTLGSINGAALFAGLALGAAILVYNWRHKGNPVAPFVMGLCRALVYVVAAAAVAGSVADATLLPAAAMLLYVAGITYVARQESLNSVSSLWPLILLAAPLVVALPATDFSIWALVALAGLGVCAVRVAQLLRRRAAGDVSAAVGLLIAAVALNDTLFSTTTDSTYAAIACLICFGFTYVLQRYVPAS